jgi:hypothetical protein
MTYLKLREKSSQSFDSFKTLRDEKNRRFVSFAVKEAK